MALRKLTLPERFIGEGYILIELVVRKSTPLTLLLDTGLTAPVMLTASACARLGLASLADAPLARSIGATSNMWLRTVQLEAAELRGRDGRVMDLGPMSGVVTDDFTQRKIGEEVGVVIDGMLGQGFLELCDLEVDSPRGLLRAWPPRGLPRGQPGWRPLAPLPLPGSLQGLLLSVPGALEAVVGIVDSGSSHTVVNRHAAYVLGLEAASAQSELQGAGVRGIGLDGSALEMPLVTVENAMLCGARYVTMTQHARARSEDPKSWSFGNATCPRAERVGPLAAVQLAVGDIAFFEELLSQPQETFGQFKGPAALLGQDLLGQLPLQLSAKDGRILMRQP